MKASEHDPSEFVKFLYIGDSGTGKTGSLVSLLEAGYEIKMLDMDSGIGTLIQYAKEAGPDVFDRIDYQSFRDKFTVRNGELKPKGTPRAYVDALKALEKWDDDSDPAEWGSKTIFVLDSLTAFSRAAFLWAQGMNPTSKDPRQWYGAAQDSVRTAISMLTSEDFRANVIVISHVSLQELPDGSTKGYTSAIGKALGPQIPQFFNTLLLAESRGSGEKVRRTIQTMPTALIDLKAAVPAGKLERSLPLETGLATVFEQLKS